MRGEEQREKKLWEAALVEERCEEVAGDLPEASPRHFGWPTPRT